MIETARSPRPMDSGAATIRRCPMMNCGMYFEKRRSGILETRLENNFNTTILDKRRSGRGGIIKQPLTFKRVLKEKTRYLMNIELFSYTVTQNIYVCYIIDTPHKNNFLLLVDCRLPSFFMSTQTKESRIYHLFVIVRAREANYKHI